MSVNISLDILVTSTNLQKLGVLKLVVHLRNGTRSKHEIEALSRIFESATTFRLTLKLAEANLLVATGEPLSKRPGRHSSELPTRWPASFLMYRN